MTTVVVGGAVATASCDDTTGMLIAEDAEGTGTPTDWTDTPGTGGSVNWDSTSSPLRGSQSLVITAGDSGQESYTTYSIGEITSGSIAFRYSTNDATPTAHNQIVRIYDLADQAVIQILNHSTGNIRIIHGTTSITTDFTSYAPMGKQVMQNDTTYYIWVDFTLGAGTNGTATAYVSTTKTKPASAAVSTTSGTGLSSSPIERVKIKAQYQTVCTYDQIRVDNATIGDLCE